MQRSYVSQSGAAVIDTAKLRLTIGIRQRYGLPQIEVVLVIANRLSGMPGRCTDRAVGRENV